MHKFFDNQYHNNLEFTEFGLDERLLKGIDILGFDAATPVQDKTIPMVMQGKDVIAIAQTGTGKTAAFLLPLVHKIIHSEPSDHIKALIIVPTRELAIQIDQQMEGLSYYTPVRSIAVYGGTGGGSFSMEKTALSQGADIVICTPGKMISHLNMGYVKISGLKYLVLDEADRMLDIGFYDDIMRIISYLPENRQSLMFSATFPPKIRELAKKILKDPVEINIGISKPAEKILQLAYVVYENQKVPLLKYLLSDNLLKSVLVFCSTKKSAKELARELKKQGLAVQDIHSDLDQNQRKEALTQFKNKKLQILVATDILSRGIDIEDIDQVINFDVPNDGEDYIHRIGRTARAEADGIAITFISPKEQSRFRAIEQLLGDAIHKAVVPHQFGETPEYKPPRHRQGGKRNFRSSKKR